MPYILKIAPYIIASYDLANPVACKETKNETILQRRMDSLSRILSIDTKITPCIAVAFVGKQLFITSNTPMHATEQTVRDMISEKLLILGQFLSKFELTNDVKNENCLDIKFSPSALKVALETANSIMEYGYMGIIRAYGKQKYRQVNQRLQVDLLKIAKFSIQGFITQGQRGFSKSQLDVLQRGEAVFHFPSAEVEAEKLALHAEQLMLLKYCQAAYIQDLDPITIGMNKLACQACETVLGKHKDKVTYRGTSNVGYPNVLDITTGSKYLHIPKRSQYLNLSPDDSDSEIEIDEDDARQKTVTDKKELTAAASCRFYQLPVKDSTLKFQTITTHYHYERK